MKFTTVKIGVILLVLLSIAGCETSLKARNDQNFENSKDLVLARKQAMEQRILSNAQLRIASQDVSRPYLAGNSVDISREVNMPDVLRVSLPVTAYFSNTPVDVATALNQLSQASGVSITALPDVFQAPSNFDLKTMVAANSVAVQSPQKITLQFSNVQIWKILDDIGSQIQASWRPTSTGAEFFRVETKTYELMTIPQVANTSASLGRTGSAQNAFNSDSKTSFEMKGSDQIEGLRLAVDALLSRAGKFVISKESQTLVVTDTPAAQERVAAFIKKQNKIMSGRVRLLIEAIDVVSKEGAEFGLDWNLVYNTAQGALTASTPASLTSAQATGVTFQQMTGPFAGSGLVMKALSEVGTVVNRRVFPLMTTNGRPITQALRTTFNYVDQVQTTSVSGSTNTAVQAPTVTQKDETVGTFLTIVPTAKSDGSVFLSVSFDVTTADPLRPYTVGTGASAVTVQQKTINGSGVIQEVSIHNGKTEVIGGVELSTTQNTIRRMGDGMPIIAGGSNTSTLAKTLTVFLVTAVLEEGV